MNNSKNNILNSDQPAEVEKPALPTIQEKISNPTGSIPAMPGTSLDGLKDLLEKNLRWSQLIYEQNKKILRQIFWGTVFTWAKIIVTLAILILVIIFASSWYANLQKKYPFIFGAPGKQTATSTPPSSVDEFLKILPLNDIQRQQLKNFIK